MFIDAAVRHPTCYVEQPDITDPAELKAWGQTVLHTYTRPQAEYEVELTEAYQPTGGYVPSLGDEGVVIDEALGARLQVRVTSIEVDELARSVKAACATQVGELGAMAQLVSNGPLSATTGGTGTTSASLLLTTTKSPYTSGITAYDRNVNGHNTFWRAGGNLVIGAGEYADGMRDNDIGSCLTGTGENLYLGADTSVYIHSNGNNVADRKAWTFSSSGNTTFPRGGVEVGNYIDLHTADDTMDFTGRLHLANGQMAVVSTDGGYSSTAGNDGGRYVFRHDGSIGYQKYTGSSSSWGSLSYFDVTKKYLPLTGGTLTGEVNVEVGSGSARVSSKRTDTSVKVSLLVGSAGVNHGVWSDTLGKWIVYADSSNIHLNGNAETATKLATSRTIRTNLASTSTASFDGSANVTPGVTGVLGFSNGGTNSSGTSSSALPLASGAAAYNDDQTPNVVKWGKVVQVVGAVKPKSEVAAGGSLTIGTLPSGSRPRQSFAQLCQGSSGTVWLLEVNSNGAMTASRYRNGSTNIAMPTTAWLPFNVTFVVA